MSLPDAPAWIVARVAARAGHQRDEVEPVAAVERQALHLLRARRARRYSDCLMSTSGVSPVTVTFSWTVASFSVKVRFAGLADARAAAFCCVSVEKPDSSTARRRRRLAATA